MAVSYTHLDVYKRQAYVFPLAMVLMNSFKRKAYISRAPFALPTGSQMCIRDSHVRDADEHKQRGQDVLADAFTPHYCCTSLLWVARSWMSAMAATRMQNSTALAWPMPRELEMR